jgi:nitrogen regulatory protein P-II 1
MVVADKDARKVVEMISQNSGLSSNHGGKIFVSEMEEVVDMETLDGNQDLEMNHLEDKIESKSLPKRSRFVPLQKFTLHKLQVIYENNKETLRSDYRIKSFSDFVNYCIMKSLPSLEKQLKNPTIVYENNFGDF